MTTIGRIFCLAVAVLACAVLPLVARADDATAPIHAERAQIRDEKAAAAARLATRERECLERFVATPCLDEARRDNRETLSRLRHRDAQLDAQERKLRSDARRQEIADNQQRDRERQKEAAAPERRESLRQEAAPQVTVRPRPTIDAPRIEHLESPAERQVDEARSRAEFDARQRAIDAHREAVEARNLERAAKGKVAAPLPMPPASAP